MQTHITQCIDITIEYVFVLNALSAVGSTPEVLNMWVITH